MKSTPLVPLHVSDAPDRLDLRNLGSKLTTVLVLPLFKQVLVASVAWVLIAHPADAEEGKKRHNNIKNNMRLSRLMTHKEGGLTCRSEPEQTTPSPGSRVHESWGHHHL